MAAQEHTGGGAILEWVMSQSQYVTSGDCHLDKTLHPPQ